MVGDQQLGNSSFVSLNGRLIKSYIYHLYKALDINLATQLVYIYLPTNPGTFGDRSPILSSPVFSVGYYCYTMSLSCNRSIHIFETRGDIGPGLPALSSMDNPIAQYCKGNIIQ